MRLDAPGEEPGQGSQPQDQGAEQDLRHGRRAWRSEHARMAGDFAWTISLMDTVGRTEKDIADTLRAMAAEDGSEAATRRLSLAAEAARGAYDAAEHSEQLRRQADRLARHADVVALLRSVDHAGRVLADLVRMENDIADTLTSLASRGGPGRDAQLRHLAEEALTGAQRASDRARSLHDLAAWVVGESQPCRSA